MRVTKLHYHRHAFVRYQIETNRIYSPYRTDSVSTLVALNQLYESRGGWGTSKHGTGIWNKEQVLPLFPFVEKTLKRERDLHLLAMNWI